MSKRIFSIAAVAALVGLAACAGEEAAVENEAEVAPVVAVPVATDTMMAPPAAGTMAPMPGDTMNMGATGTMPMTGDTMNMGAGTTTTPMP